MKIAICDDDDRIRKELCQMCKKFQMEASVDVEIVEMKSGEEVLHYSDDANILILDIELPGKNGIQVMKEIEKKDQFDYIVFVSGHQEAVWNSFSCKTVGFIRKPASYHQLEKILKKIALFVKEECLIEVDTDQGINMIKSSDLIYIKGEGSYTRVVTVNDNLIVRRTISQWEQQLATLNMLRAHKSYFVNMEYIKCIKQNVVLHNGEEIKISRLRKVELMEKYHDFLKKKAFFI